MLNVGEESLLLMLVGMGSVLAVLVFLALLIWAMAAIDERVNALRVRRYASRIVARGLEDEINDELVAVLAAATMTLLGPRVRVRRVRLLRQAAAAEAWAVSGRLNIMASHAVPKRQKNR